MEKEIDKFKKELLDRNKKKKSKRGFTLVELLAVFIILAIIAGIAVYSMSSIRDTAEKSIYTESVKNLLTAAQDYYSQDGGASFPESGIAATDYTLQVENQSKYVSGTIVYNEGLGKLVAVNVSDGNYCANGPIDELVVVEGACPTTDLACFEYEKNDEGITITGYDLNNTACLGNVTVPAEIEDLPVTRIGYGAFADIEEDGELCYMPSPEDLLSSSKASKDDNCVLYTTKYDIKCFEYYGENRCFTNYDLSYDRVGDKGYKITGMSLPSTVTYIDNLAFAKTGIGAVNFGSLSNLTYIGDSSFYNSNLTSINLNGLRKLKVIGYNAFAESFISYFDIKTVPNLEEIRAGAFAYNYIENVDFTGTTSVLHIGNDAFYDNMINNIYVNSLINLYSLDYNAFCRNPFYYTDSIPDTNNIKNVSWYDLDHACLYEIAT